MDDPDALLYPYVTAPRRIGLDIVDALAACPAVSRVALFGSLAEGTNDGWSDIDVVCAVEGEDGAWQAAEALRAAIPLRWHGTFSGVPAPSGRHWPLGESVFHSVDLSYRDEVAHERLLREGLGGHILVTKEVVHRRGLATPGRPRPSAMSEDYAFTHALYAAVKAMKLYLRDAGPWADVPPAMHALEAVASPLPAHVGLDPQDVLAETRTLYTALMLERSRYGGE